MTVKLKIFIKCVLLLFCLSTAPINAQILKDTSTVNLIKKGVDAIYNFRFKDAGEVCSKINESYPGHPVVYLLKGMITYWQNFPLLTTSPARTFFEEDLHNCIDLCEKNNDPDYEAENVLANLCARGMLLSFYADNDLNLEVFPLATSTYKYIRRSFNFISVSSDFCYFAGVYDYYREAYPEAYPIYKPLAVLFPRGNKAKGIKELQKASINSIVLRAESLSFLAEVFLRFENDYQQATYYNKTLYELYPANTQFKEEYIKNLLLIKQYDEAERLILSSDSTLNNSFFMAQFTIFHGIIMEKKYHDNKQAQEFYMKGVREIGLFGKYGNEFAAWAYLGLSRISDANGDKHYKKLYRKLAGELADIRKINFDP